MDLFGDGTNHQESLTPCSNPRTVDFFNESQNSAAGHGGNGRGTLDGLDLNSQALNFPHLKSYSAFLQVDAPVDDGGAGASGGLQGYGRARSTAVATNSARLPPSRSGRGGRRGGGEMRGSASRGGGEIRGSASRCGGTARAPPFGTASASASVHVGGIIGDATPDAPDEVPDKEDEGFVQGNEDMFDKATWNMNNTVTFCGICIEEISAENTSNGTMTSRAYKNMAEKYLVSTGLRHSKTQLKNRWDQLKKLYAFWLWLNKQTGNGAIFYDDGFWEKYAKGKTEWKRLRNGPPEYLQQLETMFANSVVDGSTACILGEHNGDEVEDGYKKESNEGSTMNIGTKRTTSMGTCATSPMKKVKSPMVKIMKGFVENMQSKNNLAHKVMQGEIMVEEINKAMKLVVECGAAEGSAEHYVATKILVKPENRAMFFTLTSNEGRLSWLKRWCKDKNID